MIASWLAPIVAGGLAAAVVYPLNRAVQKRCGAKALLQMSPIWEETAKTWAAYMLGSGLLFAHLVFGLVEAVGDWHAHNAASVRTAAFSLVFHGFCGLLGSFGALILVRETAPDLLLWYFGTPLGRHESLVAWAISTTTHWLWNRRVLLAM